MNIGDHYFLQSAQSVEQICQPIMEIGISYFTYLKKFSDGSHVNLSSSPEWLKHYYDLKLYESSRFEGLPESYQAGCTIWPKDLDLPVFSHARTHFDSDHGMTIIHKNIDYCEFFFFSTSAYNPQIIDVYLNSLDLFQRFTYYFKEKAHSIIQQAEQYRIIIQPSYTLSEHPYQLADHNTQAREELVKKMPVSMVKLSSNRFDKIHISQRGLACLRHLVQGKTAAETAEALFISSRTVEDHLNSLKVKLNCKNKIELIARFTASELRSLIIEPY